MTKLEKRLKAEVKNLKARISELELHYLPELDVGSKVIINGSNYILAIVDNEKYNFINIDAGTRWCNPTSTIQELVTRTRTQADTFEVKT